MIVSNYEERNVVEEVTSTSKAKPTFTVERRRTYEYRLGDGEWDKDVDVEEVAVVIYGEGQNYRFGRFDTVDQYINSQNIDMMIQVLQDVKASGVLEVSDD